MEPWARLDESSLPVRLLPKYHDLKTLSPYIRHIQQDARQRFT